MTLRINCSVALVCSNAGLIPAGIDTSHHLVHPFSVRIGYSSSCCLFIVSVFIALKLIQL